MSQTAELHGLNFTATVTKTQTLPVVITEQRIYGTPNTEYTLAVQDDTQRCWVRSFRVPQCCPIDLRRELITATAKYLIKEVQGEYLA